MSNHIADCASPAQATGNVAGACKVCAFDMIDELSADDVE